MLIWRASHEIVNLFDKYTVAWDWQHGRFEKFNEKAELTKEEKEKASLKTLTQMTMLDADLRARGLVPDPGPVVKRRRKARQQIAQRARKRAAKANAKDAHFRERQARHAWA